MRRAVSSGFQCSKLVTLGKCVVGFLFLGLVPKGVSLQCKTEVEIKLVVLKCRAKLFRAFKRICYHCYHYYEFQGCFCYCELESSGGSWLFFFPRQELHDPMMKVLCLRVEIILMDNSLCGFGKGLVKQRWYALLLQCLLVLELSFRAQTPGGPWDFWVKQIA